MIKEEAKEFLSHYICCCQRGNSPFDCNNATCGFGIAIRTLCDEERPHDKWIMNKTSARGRNYTCTNCKKVSRNKYNFCPNCGADMRGDDYGS